MIWSAVRRRSLDLSGDSGLIYTLSESRKSLRAVETYVGFLFEHLRKVQSCTGTVNINLKIYIKMGLLSKRGCYNKRAEQVHRYEIKLVKA